jgi:WD40 repeat protein
MQPSTLRLRGWTAALVGVGLATLALAGRPPTADEAREQQTHYRAEHDAAVKAADRFPAPLLRKAEEIARRGDAALEAGRLLQAVSAYRQARWQLPYLAPEVPEHVGRVLGGLRLRHAREVSGLAFSPDGKRLVTASKDRTVVVWDLASGRELRRYLGHTANVRAVAFSRDGKTVASAGDEANIKLWDAGSGKDVRALPTPAGVTALAFSPDGKHLAATCDDRALRVFETATGTLRRAIERLRAVPQSVAFSPDGSALAMGFGGTDGQVFLWQFPKMVENANQPEFWSQQDFAGASYHLAFSPDGKTLARSGPDSVKLYSVPSPGSVGAGGQLRRALVPAGRGVRYTCTAYGKDGKTLFVGGSDGVIYLFDPDNGQALGTFRGHTAAVTALAVPPDAGQLASASADHTVRLWPYNVSAQARAFEGHAGPVWTAAFSPDAQRLVTASGDKTVRIWEAAGGKVLHTLKGHELAVTCALFTPDGKAVLSAGADRVLRLWNADSGAELHTFKGHEGTVTAADISPDGKTIVSGGADGLVKLWDGEGKELLNLAPKVVVTAVDFSPDGEEVASGHVDGTVRLWDAASGKPLRRFLAHDEAVGGLAYSPDGKLLASGGADARVRVWRRDEPRGRPLVFSGHTGPVSSVAFRPDSRYLISAGSDAVIKLWKLDGGSTKDSAQDFRGHKDWVSSVVFSRDGFYIASASVDRTARVWEVTSREIPLVAEHSGAVLAVAVSPDGKTAASGGSDRTIKLWDLATGNERLTLTGHQGDVVALAFTPDGKTLVSSGTDKTLRRWDVVAGRELTPQPGHLQHFHALPNAVPALRVTPDGQRLVVWLRGNERYTTLKVLDLATGRPVLGDNDTNRNVTAVAFTADGKQAAVGAADGTLRRYTLGRIMEPAPGGDWFVFDSGTGFSSLAYSPDGALLIAGSDKGDVKVLRSAKRETVHTLKAHAQAVTACAVSSDGKRFATAGNDNVVKLWDTASGKELRRWDLHLPVQERGGLVAALAFTADGRGLITANANTTLYVLELP